MNKPLPIAILIAAGAIALTGCGDTEVQADAGAKGDSAAQTESAVQSGATEAGQAAGSDSRASNGDQSSGDIGEETAIPADWTALDLNDDGYAGAGEVAEAAPGIDFERADDNDDGNLSRVEFLELQEDDSGNWDKAKAQTETAEAETDDDAGERSSGGDTGEARKRYDTALAAARNAPKGNLKNPYDPGNEAMAEAGHETYMNYGCNGCHGGTGGGGMCPPLTNPTFVYGDDPDTLFRLIVLGSKKLQERGYSRRGRENVVGAMPAQHTVVNDPDEIWKIVNWVISLHHE